MHFTVREVDSDMVDYGDERRDTHILAGPDSPLSPLFWTHPATGGAILRSVAAAHLAAGLLATGVALAWLTLTPNALVAVAVVAAGVGVAAAGLLGLQLGGGGAQSALAARILLPVADLVACCAVLWLPGMRGYVPALCIIPVCVAALLLSWRSGAVIAALALMACAAATVVLGATTGIWATETLAMASAMALLVFCVGIYVSRVSGTLLDLRDMVTRLERERAQRIAERHRLLETVSVLEDAHARGERERSLIHHQLSELAAVARRISDGELAAAQSLRPGMFGPLDVLAGALVRLTSQVGGVSNLRLHVRAQQRALDALSATVRGQAHLLDGAGTTVRELGAEANQLIAEVQTVQRGSGELPGIDRHQLFRALRGVERRAMAQASNAAMLSASVTQLKARQGELESELRRLEQLTAAARTFDSSGILSVPNLVSLDAIALNSVGSVPPGSGIFAASGLLSREEPPTQRPSRPRTAAAALRGAATR